MLTKWLIACKFNAFKTQIKPLICQISFLFTETDRNSNKLNIKYYLEIKTRIRIKSKQNNHLVDWIVQKYCDEMAWFCVLIEVFSAIIFFNDKNSNDFPSFHLVSHVMNNSRCLLHFVLCHLSKRWWSSLRHLPNKVILNMANVCQNTVISFRYHHFIQLEIHFKFAYFYYFYSFF